MNTSSTSSFLAFFDGTSSGGNNNVNGLMNKVYFFEGGKILIPNSQTTEAVYESERLIGNAYHTSEDLLSILND